jgi:SSS family solute:Na+ symporter
LTALTASLMSGLAANISAFAAVWTEDIYRVWLKRGESDRHYLMVGRWAVVAATAISIVASYLNFLFRDLMEHVQMIFSIFGSPFWAIFLLGMATTRVGTRGAISGFLAGVCTAALHLVAVSARWLHYGSIMNANFHAAIYAFSIACIVALACGTPKLGAQATPEGLIFRWRAGLEGGSNRLLWVLAALLLTSCVALNIALR